jgi:YesN/AraC family two-component response regulator
MTIRVALVDDQELVRVGLAMVIDATDDIQIVMQAADGAEAVAKLAGTRVDIVLMDVQMPRMNGVEATKVVTARENAPKVIVLTTFDLDATPTPRPRSGSSSPRPP